VTVAELWREAYQGEVLGEAIFGFLAERETDAGRAAMLTALTELERSTKALAEPVFERNGYDRGDDAATIAAALANPDALAAMGWEDFLRSITPIAEGFLVQYRQLVDLVDNADDRAIAEAYVEHELALVAFARRALGEEPGEPLEPIRALAHELI
jgi:hypothetical protein